MPSPPAGMSAPGLGVEHLKHWILDAKLLIWQAGQVQSPGRTFPYPPPNPERGEGGKGGC